MNMDRKTHLDQLLRPIKWHPSSSLRSRQNLVCQRHHDVGVILPFLTQEEIERAKQWSREEAHSGLWE